MLPVRVNVIGRAKHVAAFANEKNDRLQLKAVRESGGLAIVPGIGEEAL